MAQSLILLHFILEADNFGGTGLDPARRGTQTMAVDYSSSTTDSTDPYSAGRFQAATRDGFSHDTYGPPPSRAAYDPYHAMASGVGYGDSLVGNGPPGMYQQGCVLMVYGLNKDKMNAIRLFNLFCLYGNVVRVNTTSNHSENVTRVLHNKYCFWHKV